MPPHPPRPDMPTTQWSLISRLRGDDVAEARTALDELCCSYHYPLYCHIRRRGLDHHDAEDVLHDFLSKLLRNESFGLANSEKGRLRTFLLTALQRFLINWQEGHQRLQQREISQESLEIIAGAERRFELDEYAHSESPDRLYDRQWMQQLMKLVLNRLKERYESKGRGVLFHALHPVLLDGGSLSDHDSESLAKNLEIRPGALRTSLYRLLNEYREALRQEILQTVENREMAKQEFSELMAMF